MPFDLQTLLGDMPKTQFVSEFFHRLPFSRPATARPFRCLATWDTLHEILCHDSADVMVVRDGRQSSGAVPDSGSAAQSLVAEGHTILVRHAEKHDRQLRELAAEFERDFDAAVDIHLYVTPPGRHGFSWHYDAEDVFIIQTGGEKEYSLRKNTVHPWPLVETIPEDMKYSREIMPLMRVLLKPGDWLYLPCGYWHKAEAPPGGEPSISLALGVLSPSGIDLLDHLRTHLLESLLWRGRLPVRGAARSQSEAELLQQYRDISERLIDELRRTMLDDAFLRSFLNLCRDDGV